MIILPIQASDNHRLDELLLSVLTKSRMPLSIRDITVKVNGFYELKKRVSQRAVRQALTILVDKKVVVLDNETAINHFYVNEDALEQGVTFALKYLQANDLFKRIRAKCMQPSFSEEFKFDSLESADHFLDELELIWIEELREKEHKTIFGQLLFNRPATSHVHTATKLYKDKDIIHYILCKHDSIANKAEGKWKQKNAFIRVDVDFGAEIEMFVMGDYTISVKYHKDVLKYLRKLYKEKRDPKSPSNMKGAVSLTVQKNASVALMLRNQMQKSFPHQLQGMLDELRVQKENKKALEIADKWNYMLKEQVAFLVDTEEFNSIHAGDTPWMSCPEEILLVNQFTDSLKNYFNKDRPLSIIDLGVGPFIKPTIFLNRLDATFKEIEYVAVDYSQQVLDHAKKHANRFLPHTGHLKFVKSDFMDFGSNPNVLLDHVKSPQRLFMFIGGTYGNFESEECVRFLKSILRPNDLLIIGVEALEDAQEYDEIASRYDEVKVEFNLKRFYELGFSDSDFNHSFSFNPETWAVEGHMIVENVPSHLILPFREVGLKVGDKIKFFKSRKPTREMLDQELRQLGNIELSFKKIDKTLVAFGRML